MRQGLFRLVLLTICFVAVSKGLEAGNYSTCAGNKKVGKSCESKATVKAQKPVGFELSPLETFLLNI